MRDVELFLAAVEGLLRFLQWDFGPTPFAILVNPAPVRKLTHTMAGGPGACDGSHQPGTDRDSTLELGLVGKELVCHGRTPCPSFVALGAGEVLRILGPKIADVHHKSRSGKYNRHLQGRGRGWS